MLIAVGMEFIFVSRQKNYEIIHGMFLIWHCGQNILLILNYERGPVEPPALEIEPYHTQSHQQPDTHWYI